MLRHSRSVLHSGVWQNLGVLQEKPEVQIFLSNLIFKCWQLMRIYNSYVTAGRNAHRTPTCLQAMLAELVSLVQMPTGTRSDALEDQG